MSKENLFKVAILVREKAYAPYSNFKVGAAVVTEKGNVFSGCNVENTSYGLTVCAERIAIFNAVSYGEKNIQELLVVADEDFPVAPCGACRQVMHEFKIKTIHIANVKGEIKTYTLEELLPLAFYKDDFKK